MPMSQVPILRGPGAVPISSMTYKGKEVPTGNAFPRDPCSRLWGNERKLMG